MGYRSVYRVSPAENNGISAGVFSDAFPLSIRSDLDTVVIVWRFSRLSRSSFLVPSCVCLDLRLDAITSEVTAGRLQREPVIGGDHEGPSGQSSDVQGRT
jgi:hypothetical protein